MYRSLTQEPDRDCTDRSLRGDSFERPLPRKSFKTFQVIGAFNDLYVIAALHRRPQQRDDVMSATASINLVGPGKTEPKQMLVFGKI